MNTFQLLTADQQSINSWRLPVVVALNDGKIGVIENFDGEDTLEVSFFDDKTYTNRLSMRRNAARHPPRYRLGPLAAQERTAAWTPTSQSTVRTGSTGWWMRDLRPLQLGDAGGAVYQCALPIRALSFPCKVYDRVIPAQS
ncbi:hypothetical protein M1V99_17360 [Enterobacter bugandensis]|uniref:hypothetical protein n=1 Tax=Enterobacter bugandensis TaxID=881260 RepID=UPI0020196F8E|nr:hypothetical protein [Enterobacter bugandensis]UQQ29900.1 hypothetical protein M1V99_17360 [Enterobacter bugandensis]